MIVDWKHALPWLIDPVDGSPLTVVGGEALESATGRRYPIVDSQPHLLPDDGFESGGWRFEPIVVSDATRPKPTGAARRVFKRVKRALRRGSGGEGAAARLLDLVTERSGTESSRVLVVGGASVGDRSETLTTSPDVDVISFDVYPTAVTTFVADGHRIPLADGSVSAVWIQAVLEHVYRPEAVVAEIVRVLEPDGLVYAETPFLQPVHEGAYDYARFTQSGHRLLFSDFDEIDAGSLGGPAAAFALAVRGLVGGLTRSRKLAAIAFACCFPIVLLDRAIPAPWRSDFATGVFFLGRKSGDTPRPFSATAEYRGVQ